MADSQLRQICRAVMQALDYYGSEALYCVDDDSSDYESPIAATDEPNSRANEDQGREEYTPTFDKDQAELEKLAKDHEGNQNDMLTIRNGKNGPTAQDLSDHLGDHNSPKDEPNGRAEDDPASQEYDPASQEYDPTFEEYYEATAHAPVDYLSDHESPKAARDEPKSRGRDDHASENYTPSFDKDHRPAAQDAVDHLSDDGSPKVASNEPTGRGKEDQACEMYTPTYADDLAEFEKNRALAMEGKPYDDTLLQERYARLTETANELEARVKGMINIWTPAARPARCSVGFLDLPAELRDLVYEFAVTDKDLRRKRQTVITSSKQAAFKTYLALAQTCQQLKSEVMLIFFVKNVFSLNSLKVDHLSCKGPSPLLVTNWFMANIQMLTILDHKTKATGGATFTMRIEKIKGTTSWAMQMTDAVLEKGYPRDLIKIGSSMNSILIVEMNPTWWMFMEDDGGLLRRLVWQCHSAHACFMIEKSQSAGLLLGKD